MQNHKAETEMKLAGEVWHDWCLHIFKDRPRNRRINSPMGEEVFILCFDFMRRKFQFLLEFKYLNYTIEKIAENYIPNILIDPNDWIYSGNFWTDIYIFIRYNLSEEEILTAMKSHNGAETDPKKLKAYIQFRKGLKKLRKLYESEANK